MALFHQAVAPARRLAVVRDRVVPAAVLMYVLDGGERGARGHADRAVGIRGREAGATRCELVEIGRLDLRVPIAAGHALVVLVRQDDDQVGRFHLYFRCRISTSGTPLSMSPLRLVSAPSILRHTSSTSAARAYGTNAMPASSAQTRSPGRTPTPEICTVPLTSTVCMRHLPVIGEKPLHHTGQPIWRYWSGSRNVPSTIAPMQPSRRLKVADCPPILEQPITPSMTSTSPGFARLCASVSPWPLALSCAALWICVAW